MNNDIVVVAITIPWIAIGTKSVILRIAGVFLRYKKPASIAAPVALLGASLAYSPAAYSTVSISTSVYPAAPLALKKVTLEAPVTKRSPVRRMSRVGHLDMLSAHTAVSVVRFEAVGANARDR